MNSDDLTNKKTMTKTNTMAMPFREHSQRAVLETCDLRLDTLDTDFILTIENINIYNYIVTFE